MISLSVAPWERPIRSIISDFLLPSRAISPVSLRTPRAVWRRLLFGATFFRLPFALAALAACFVTFADKTWTAFQMRSTATLRFVNLFTGARSVKGATPAKLFQISAGRFAGQEAINLASSWAEPKYPAWLILAARASSSEAKAVMLLFASIVKVFIATPFITRFEPKAK